MKLAEIKRELGEAGEVLQEALREAESEKRKLQRVATIQGKSKNRVQEIIEGKETRSLPEVVDKIAKLNLIQKILANMQMNLDLLKKTNLKQLRPNQLKGLKAFVEFLKAQNGTDLIGYFKQPTGAGKTIFFGLLTRLIGLQTLILVPRNTLLGQTKEELTSMLGFEENEIGIVGEGQYEIGRPVTISTYQSHISRMKTKGGNGDKRSAYREWMQKCAIIVCDEGHRSLGPKTKKSLDALKEEGEFDLEMTEADEKYQNQMLSHLDEYKNVLILGFSATPRLADKSMDQYFIHRIAEEKYTDLVKAGILTKFKIIYAEGEIFEEETRGTMIEEKEQRILEREQMARKLLTRFVHVRDKLKKEGKRLFGAAFCLNIESCDKFGEIAQELGVKYEIVTSREKTAEMKKSKADRENIVKRAENKLLSGKIELIVSVDMLTEGWNCRPVNCAIVNRVTYSEAKAIQGPGRIARAYPDKDYGYVFEGEWKVRKSFPADGAEEKKQKIQKGEKDNKSLSSGTGHGRKPLTFAAALYQYEENPEEICETMDGRKLEYEINLQTDENGITTLDSGEMVVSIRRYSSFRKCSAGKMMQQINDAGISPVPNIYGPKRVELFFKSDIEALIPPQRNEAGNFIIDEKEASTIHNFARSRNMGVKAVEKFVSKANLQPIPDQQIQARGEMLNLYWVDTLESVLPITLKHDGTTHIEGVEAIGITAYAPRQHIKPGTLRSLVTQANLQPLSTQVLSHSQTISVFNKQEVDRLLKKYRRS